MEKVIEGYPNYTVDEVGVVKNIKRGRALTPHIYAGYECVQVRSDNKPKWEKIHRLVAKAFIPNPHNLPCVNHKDENKLNNNVDNLEWCDHAYNNSYGNNAPLKRMLAAVRKKVVMYDTDGNLIAEFASATEAQRKTGIKQSNISKCCLGRKHFRTAGGYVWKFK